MFGSRSKFANKSLTESLIHIFSLVSLTVSDTSNVSDHFKHPNDNPDLAMVSLAALNS